MFATPRTGTLAYEIAIKPFTEGLSMNMETNFSWHYSLVFLCGYPLAHKSLLIVSVIFFDTSITTCNSVVNY